MARISWDAIGERRYETGVDRGVLYPRSGGGVAWNGLVSVTESPDGGDLKSYYMDGIKYLNQSSPEEYVATIEAFTYPDEFGECDGSATIRAGFSVHHQPRKPFDLCYRSKIGNDLEGQDFGYKIHLIYNAMASPTERNHQSIGESPDAGTFSWGITTIPVEITGYKPSAHFVINSTKVNSVALAAVEDIIYGSEEDAPRMPTPDEIDTLLGSINTLMITDNGDGTFTAVGADEFVSLIDSTTFQISSLGAVVIDEDTYTLTSI